MSITDKFCIKKTSEIVISLDASKITVIDGIEYIDIYRFASDRPFLMRKDELESIDPDTRLLN
jgi:hypothetical protein